MSRYLVSPVLALIFALASGCASVKFGPNDFKIGEERRMVPVQMGNVIDVRSVEVEVASGTTLRMAGAGAAAAICYRILDSHAILGFVAGAFCGGTVYSATGALTGKQQAQAIVVRFDNGQLGSLVQEPGATALAVGDRVLIEGNRAGGTRITKLTVDPSSVAPGTQAPSQQSAPPAQTAPSAPSAPRAPGASVPQSRPDALRQPIGVKL